MKTLKRLSLQIGAGMTSALITVPSALAGGVNFGDKPDIGGQNDIRGGVENILKGVLNFLALIAVIFIVIAGIRLVTSQGEDDAKDKAKNTIIYVAVGLIVIIFARAMVEFFSNDIFN